MNLKSNVSLMAELCAICNVDDDNMRNKVWNTIQKYHIKDVITYIDFEQSLEAFLNAKRCEELSEQTISNYKHALQMFGKWSENRPVADIDINDLRAYLLYLKEDRKLKRLLFNNISRF